MAFTMLLWLFKRGHRSGKRDDAEAALVQMHLSWQERRKRWLDFVARKLSEIEARGASKEQVDIEDDDLDPFDVDPFEDFHVDPFENFPSGTSAVSETRQPQPTSKVRKAEESVDISNEHR